MKGKAERVTNKLLIKEMLLALIAKIVLRGPNSTPARQVYSSTQQADAPA